MRDVFIRELEKQVENNSRIILITGDLGFGVLDRFQSKFPKNYINAGVAEQNMTGIAAGLALEGRIVFTYSIGNFPTLRCLEQIRNDICYHNLNVNIVSIGAGFSYGALGMSHHATEDLSIMRSLPEMTVISPCGSWETENATREVISFNSPTFLRLDKSEGDDSPISDMNEKFTIGKGRKLSDGKDCAIFVTGGILEEVQKSVSILKKENIDASIFALHTVKPLDKDLIISTCKKMKCVVTVEEHNITGGLGSAISEILMDHNVRVNNFLRIGLNDEYSSIVGSQQYLREQYKMDYKSIVKKIKHLMN